MLAVHCDAFERLQGPQPYRPRSIGRLLMTPILSVKQRPFRVLRRRAEGPDLFEVRCQLRSLVRDENRDELGWFGAAGVG